MYVFVCICVVPWLVVNCHVPLHTYVVGHYVAYARHPDTKNWYKYDDSDVSEGMLCFPANW